MLVSDDQGSICFLGASGLGRIDFHRVSAGGVKREACFGERWSGGSRD